MRMNNVLLSDGEWLAGDERSCWIGPSFTLCIVSILFMPVRSQRSVGLSSHYEPKRTVETPLKQ